MSLEPYERETTISFSDGDEMAQVYTAQRKVITQLRKNKAAELVAEGEHEGTAWATFKLPRDLVRFRNPSTLTEEQRKVRSDRMKQTRQEQATLF